MDETAESLTKRKAPNAYVLFTTDFVNRNKHQGGGRFRGNPVNYINDLMVIQAWDSLSPEEKQEWKDRARAEKMRAVNEYSSKLEEYITVKTAVREIEGEHSMEENGGSAAENRAIPLHEEVALKKMQLKRLTRPPKKPKPSKYGPSYMEEISTAKEFEEKRRRERECLSNIWIWRNSENQDVLKDEKFVLVSTQTVVNEDTHVPISLAFLEFTINGGIQREFSCSLAKGNFVRGSVGDPFRTNCNNVVTASQIYCEVYCEWLRAAGRDLSSKTPVFFCLADEWAETYDSLSCIYSFKDGTNPRFPPYFLAATDDLVWSLLNFFNVPMKATDCQDIPTPLVLKSKPFSDAFAMAPIIEKYFTELAKDYSCDTHQQFLTDGGESSAAASTPNGFASAAAGDAYASDQTQRCPLAVVRACATYIQNWIIDGVVDDQYLATSAMAKAAAAPAPATRQRGDAVKEPGAVSSAASVKSDDIDQLSYLDLDYGDEDVDRTLDDDHATIGGDTQSDDSEDVIEITPDRELRAKPGQMISTPASGGLSTRSKDQQSTKPSVSVDIASYREMVRSYNPFGPPEVGKQASNATAQPISMSIPSEDRSSATVRPGPYLPNVESPPSMVTAMLPSPTSKAVDPSLWTPEFRILYRAQLRLPNGCRGLGRGMKLNAALSEWANDEMDF